MSNKLNLNFVWTFSLWYPGDPEPYEIIEVNTTIDEGVTELLNKAFVTLTSFTNWSIGIIDAAGFGSIAATDTAAKITTTTPNPPTTNNWAEFTSYNETTRQNYQAASSSRQVDNNANPATFTINASATLKGAFLVANDTAKGGTTGLLISAATFTEGDRAVNNGTIFKVKAQLNA